MAGKKSLFASGMMLFAAFLLPNSVFAKQDEGKALVSDYCSACHEETDKGGLARISEVRKTPEGWDMTIFRMQHIHGLELDSDDRSAIIKYLSQENGLAPSETAPFRYVLEQRAHFVDKAVNDNLDTLCGRCHTNARYGLQRRTEGDWLKHMHFHVGQFPSLEYQARARDRFWWKEVTTKTYKELAELYPFQTAAWQDWKATKHKSPAGKWRVTGHRPGVGDYQGIMRVTKDGDYYKADYDLQDMAGLPLKGDSKAVVYTGFEWRGSGLLNDTETREVYALSADGNRMTGRWYQAAHYDIGGEFKATRIKAAKPEIMAQSSDNIRSGKSKAITFYGVSLAGLKIGADQGLTTEVIKQKDTVVTLKITAAREMTPGRYSVTVGQAAGTITVYDKLDSVRVMPEWTIARLGGGNTPPVSAQFEAFGFLNGPDGKPGTEDDIKVGLMEATWKAAPFDQDASQMKDVDFSGQLSDKGRFLPALAGPNPDRKFATDNAGNLKIIAMVQDDGREVSGAAHLIVTVQRWNLPPIR